MRDDNSDHALFNKLGSSPASMEAAKLLDAFGSQPVFFRNSKQMQSKPIYKPSSQGCPHGYHCLETGGLKTGKKNTGSPWYQCCWPYMVISDSGGIWENHLNGRVVKQGWKQILPDIWHSIFHHQELNCLLVVYVDDFKIAGPSANMEKAWASIKAAVNSGDPEPYDRYFGCMHREFENIRLPSQAHPFAFAFEAKKSAAAQHRTQDWWEHDETNQAWIRHHVQPRKRLYQPGDEGESLHCQIQVV